MNEGKKSAKKYSCVGISFATIAKNRENVFNYQEKFLD